MRKIIGIAGRSGSGKDTAAQIMVDLFGIGPCTVAHFADHFKDFVDYSIACYSDDWVACPKDVKFNGVSKRDLYVAVGESVRKLVPDFWAKIAIDILQYTSYVVIIPDVRFEVEAKAIRDAGGIVLHLSRKGCIMNTSTCDRESERGIEVAENDFLMNNDGDLDDLKISVKNFLREVSLLGEVK